MQTVDRQTMTLFEDLYKGNQKIFEEFACYFLKDSETAKDIVADCFVRLWMSRDRVAFDNAVGYMFRSVRNACLDRMKSSAFRNELNDLSFGREENPVYYRLVEENDLSDVFTDEIIAIFQKCLDGLQEEKRRSFLLSNVDGLKYKEIAELLNISEDKVDNNIRFVRKALKASLKDYLPVILLTFVGIK